jgi:outer membrane biosynthesis protein TonB
MVKLFRKLSRSTVMAKLVDFLAELAINPQKLGEFIHDPEAAMHDAGLNSEDRAALRSGFPNIIYARLAGVPIQQAFQMTSPRPTDVSQNVVSSQIVPYYQINIILSPSPSHTYQPYHQPFYITHFAPPIMPPPVFPPPVFPPPEPEPEPEPKPPKPNPPH